MLGVTLTFPKKLKTNSTPLIFPTNTSIIYCKTIVVLIVVKR